MFKNILAPQNDSNDISYLCRNVDFTKVSERKKQNKIKQNKVNIIKQKIYKFTDNNLSLNKSNWTLTVTHDTNQSKV